MLHGGLAGYQDFWVSFPSVPLKRCCCWRRMMIATSFLALSRTPYLSVYELPDSFCRKHGFFLCLFRLAFLVQASVHLTKKEDISCFFLSPFLHEISESQDGVGFFFLRFRLNRFSLICFAINISLVWHFCLILLLCLVSSFQSPPRFSLVLLTKC